MKFSFLSALAIALPMLLPLPDHAIAAPLTCVAVQVNEGEPPPSAAEFQAVLPKGGCVRDLLGWHKVEKTQGHFEMPPAQAQAYATIAGAGMQNLVTLGFGNQIYGSNGFSDKVNDQQFPATDEQIAAFKRYAVWVVSNDGGHAADAKAANIPSLYGVSIWNEMNGSWPGGIKDIHQRLAAYAKLIDVVGPAIREANPKAKIIVGATVGAKVDAWFKELFVADKMWGLNDPGVYLDVHFYLGGGLKPDNPNVRGIAQWNEAIASIRAAGIHNALFVSEWGGWLGNQVEAANPGVNYIEWMQDNFFQHENFAGTAWFELTNYGKFGTPALVRVDPDGAVAPTKLGEEFVQWWKHSSK